MDLSQQETQTECIQLIQKEIQVDNYKSESLHSQVEELTQK